MITWTNKGKEYWESYSYYKGKSVSIRAYVNGKYMILENGHIIFSGKADNRSKAIEALEDYLYPTLTVIDDKEFVEEVVNPVITQEYVQVIEATPVVEDTTTPYKLTYTVSESPVESNTIVISFEPKENTVVKYTTNGKEVISSSKIYKGEFTVDTGTPINYTVFDSEKNVIDKGSFIGE